MEMLITFELANESLKYLHFFKVLSKNFKIMYHFSHFDHISIFPLISGNTVLW